MISPEFKVNTSKSKVASELLQALNKIGSVQLLQKGEQILHEKIATDFFFYIESGLFKTYKKIEKREYVLGFTFPGDLDCDPAGLSGQTESDFIIEAIIPSKVFVCKWANLEDHLTKEKYLFTVNHFLAAYVHTIQNRLIDSLSVTAEERYKQMIQNRIEYIDQIPLSDLASYLGITRQSMSRIRNSKF